MLTLTYGYKKPQPADKGDTVFPALQTDIQQLNDHAHNGTDSAPLATQQQTLVNTNWSATSGGTYRQSVTVPTGLSFDTCEIWVKRSTGQKCYPTLERITATTFYIYTNDNSLSYILNYR